MRGGLGKIVNNTPLTDAEQYALKMATGGAAMNAAIGAGEGALTGHDITPGTVARDVALGALLTKPTPVIGKAFGFHDYVPRQPVTGNPEAYRRALTARQEETPAREPLVKWEPPKVFSPAEQIAQSTGIRQKIGKSAEESFKAIVEAQKEGGEVTPRESLQGKVDAVSKKIDEYLAKKSTVPAAKTEVDVVTEQPKVETPAVPAEPVSDLQTIVQEYMTAKGLTTTEAGLKAFNDEILAPKGLKLTLDNTIVDAKTGKPVKGQFNTADDSIKLNTGDNPTGAKATAETAAHETDHWMWKNMTPEARAQFTTTAGSEMKKLGKTNAEEYFASQGGLYHLFRQLNIRGETPLKRWWNDFKANYKTRWGKEPTTDDLLRSWNYRMQHETGPKTVAKVAGGVRNQPDKEGLKFESTVKGESTDKLEERLSQLDFHINQLKYGLRDSSVSPEMEKRWLTDYQRQKSFIEQEIIRRSPDYTRNQSPNEGLSDSEQFKAIWAKMKEIGMDHPDFQKLRAEAEALKNKYGGFVPPEQKNQPAGEGLTPDDLRKMRLNKKGEGRTPYPFTQEELSNANRITGNAFERANDSADMMRLKEESAGYTPDDLKAHKLTIRQAEILDETSDPSKIDQLTRNQPANEGLQADPNQHIIDAIVKAAKSTQPYREWYIARSKKQESTTDGEFQISLDTDTRLQDDIMSEPAVISALSEAQNPKPEKTLVHRKVEAKKEPIAPSKVEQPLLADAIKRRNIESSGKIYHHGKEVWPTDEIISEKRKQLQYSIDKEKAKIAELEEGKRINPNAQPHEVRKHLEADAAPWNWDMAISSRKAGLADKQQYFSDIELAHKVWKETQDTKTTPAAEVTPKPVTPPKQPSAEKQLSLEEAQANAKNTVSLLERIGKTSLPPDQKAIADAAIAKQRDADIRRRVMESSNEFLRSKGLGTKNQGPEEGLSTDPTAKSFLPGLASSFDKVEQKVSRPIAEAARNWQSRRDQYLGKSLSAEHALSQLPPNIINSAADKMREAFRSGKTAVRLTPEESQAADILREYYTWNVNERVANNQLIEGREAGKNPNYVPDVINEQARHTLTETPNSAEAIHMKKVWADYVMMKSEGALKREDVVRHIQEYIRAMGSPSGHYSSVDFGAVRKAQGYGLPDSMREMDARKALVSYGRRAANDMAFYKEIESQPEIQSALNIRNPITGKMPPIVEGRPDFSTTKEVKNMMNWIVGNINDSAIKHPWITAFSRLTNNLLLGAPTGLRDTASITAFAVPYFNKFSDLGAYVKGIANFRNESRNALETAARQPQIDKLAFNELKDSPNQFLATVQKAASLARKLQGREMIENFNRDVTFSIGKELAKNNILGAKAGHEKSIKFLERFNRLVEGDILTLEGDKLEAALNQIGKNFTDAVQGTYGGSGLPNFTTEGHLAPFLALQKWSIEKSNTIFKDVVHPFYTGENRMPMLTYLFASTLTGLGIQELNKQLSAKKPSDPTWKEALDKGDAAAYATQIATIMQLGSYMGIVGDGMKIIADASKGKTPRNPLAFPAYSAAADTADRIADAVMAVHDGEDPFDVASLLAVDLMSHNIQNARMVTNRVNAKDTEKKDKFRDLRVFNELEGKTASNIPTPNNYANLSAREFKRTDDLGEAVKMLPELLRQQTTKAGGDYEKLSKGLRGLKGNSYQTMPSIEDQPQTFQNYYNFLLRTQGKEAADARMVDYLKQRGVNRVKSSLVPSL